MKTTALANSSESPTSRPTMRCQTTSGRQPPTIGALAFRARRTNAAVTEPRRADADSGQHHPSVLLRRGADPRVEKLGQAYKTIATPRGKGVVVLPAPQRGRPATDGDVAIPPTRTVATWRWRRLRRAVTRVRPCAEPRFSSVTLGVSTVGPSPLDGAREQMDERLVPRGLLQRQLPAARDHAIHADSGVRRGDDDCPARAV